MEDSENINFINNENEEMKQKLQSYIEDQFSENEIDLNIHDKIKEKNKKNIFFPGYDGPLLSISLFNELQHNILPNETIQNAYTEYKQNFESKRINSFYIEHQNEEWFKEKYDQESKMKWKLEKNSQSKKLSEKFQKDFKQGIYKEINLELLEKDENDKNVRILDFTYNNNTNELEEKERGNIFSQGKCETENFLDICEPPYFAYDSDRFTLFLNIIPKNISRWQILEILKKIPGFLSMYLSEPIKSQNLITYCWVSFDCEINFENAFGILSHYKINSDYHLNPIKSKSNSMKKIRLTPCLFEDRLEMDLKYSKSLVEIFDEEKNIENNLLLSINKNEEEYSKREIAYYMDLNILYLRKVHGFCYYCQEEYDDERLLSIKCDHIHLRNYKENLKREPEIENENKNEFEWDKNFTNLIEEKILNGPRKVEKLNDSDKYLEQRKEFVQTNITKVSDDRFLCSICSKYSEKIKLDNYLSDNNKLYEKYRMVSSMDEYLDYLKRITNCKNNGNNNYDNNNNKERSEFSMKRNSDNYSKRKRTDCHRNKDLDDGDNSNNQEAVRKLISYDDL